MNEILLILSGLYLVVALVFAGIADDDPDTPKTRADRIRELAAAALWPLFHVQWRPDHSQHRRPRASADFNWVGFENCSATA